MLFFVFLSFKLHCETIATVEDTETSLLYKKYHKSKINKYVSDYVIAIISRLGLEEKKYTFSIDKINISTPIKFKKNQKHPYEGEWYYRINLYHGEITWILNVSFKAKTNQSPEIIPRIMGTTRASLILEKDILSKIAPFSHKNVKERAKDDFVNTCIVIDSKAIPPPPSLLKKDAFYEKWLVQACGQPIPFIIEFTVAPNGGTYYSIFDMTNMKSL